jgi:hypothetical protein
VEELSPAGFRVTVTYFTGVPVLNPRPTCTTDVVFSSNSGNVRLDVAPLNCGDFGAGQSLVQNLFNPAGLVAALIAGLALAYTVIRNAGSSQPLLPVPSVRLPGATASIFPRTVAAGPLRFSFTYASPLFVGTVPASPTLRFPFTWPDPVFRQPQVSIVGPTEVTLTADEGFTSDQSYAAAAVDLVSPSFQWFLDDQLVSTEGSPLITFNSPTRRIGDERRRSLRVRALDALPNPVGPRLEASAQLTVTTTTARSRPGPREPR